MSQVLPNAAMSWVFARDKEGEEHEKAVIKMIRDMDAGRPIESPESMINRLQKESAQRKGKKGDRKK